MNDAFCSIFGLPRSAILGKTLAENVPQSEREHFLSIDREVLTEGREILCEETLTIAGTKTKTILTRKNRFQDSNGNYFLVGVIHDITLRVQTDEKLKLAASVFSNSREQITITDIDATIVEVNEAFSRITGYARDEVLGHNPRFLNSGRQQPEFYVDMWKTIQEKGYWFGELWNKRKNGEQYAERKTISAICDDNGKTSHYLAIGSDITQMKAH